MQVVCTDGTIVECDKFKPEAEGLSLSRMRDNQPETVGFVPYTFLRYVLPDDIVVEFEGETEL